MWLTKLLTTQKSQQFVFLVQERKIKYTNNEQPKKKCKKTIIFTTASKRIKQLGISLTKEAKDLYVENCKNIIEKKLKTTQMKDKCSWIAMLNIVKMSLLPKRYTDPIQSPSKSQ